MFFDHLKENTKELQNQLNKTIESNVSYYKLWFFKVSVKSTSLVIKIMMLLVLVAIVVLFLSIALALALGNYFQNMAVGFLVVAGIYVLVTILLYFLFTKVFLKKLIEKFSDIFFNTTHNDD
ncbi:competence protein [Flavobacterium sp.]|uniref:competence protein n=1 Tax=Flavobacterium sp. TaxID=239 RepID=UPI0035297135